MKRAPLFLLGIAVAAAGVWLLAPYHENVVLAPALLYKLWLAIFGMGSALPSYVLSVSCFLANLLWAFQVDVRGAGPARLCAAAPGD